MKLKVLLTASLLALAGNAFAVTPPPNASTGMGHMGPCEKDPSKCAADAAKFDQWCSANMDKCNNLKAWAERRREKCEANKQKCEEHMHMMHEHMKEMRANKQNGQSGNQSQPGPNDNESQPDDQVPPPPPAS